MHPLQAFVPTSLLKVLLHVWPQPLSCQTQQLVTSLLLTHLLSTSFPCFQDTIFRWFSPPLLDPLSVYSPKINGP